MPFYRWAEIKNRKRQTPMSEHSKEWWLHKAEAEKGHEVGAGATYPTGTEATYENGFKNGYAAGQRDQKAERVFPPNDLSHVGAEIHAKWKAEEKDEEIVKLAKSFARSFGYRDDHDAGRLAVEVLRLREEREDLEAQAAHDRHDRNRFLAMLVEIRELANRCAKDPYNTDVPVTELEDLLADKAIEATSQHQLLALAAEFERGFKEGKLGGIVKAGEALEELAQKYEKRWPDKTSVPSDIRDVISGLIPANKEPPR